MLVRCVCVPTHGGGVLTDNDVQAACKDRPKRPCGCHIHACIVCESADHLYAILLLAGCCHIPHQGMHLFQNNKNWSAIMRIEIHLC